MNFSIFKKFLMLYLSFAPIILLPMDSELTSSIPAPKLPEESSVQQAIVIAALPSLNLPASLTLGASTELQVDTHEQHLDTNSLEQQQSNQILKLKNNIEILKKITELIEKYQKTDSCFLETFQFFAALSCVSYVVFLIALISTFNDPKKQRMALPGVTGFISGTNLPAITFGLFYKIYHKRQAILNDILNELMTVKNDAMITLQKIEYFIALNLSEQEVLLRKLQIASQANEETTQEILKAQKKLENILPKIQILNNK